MAVLPRAFYDRDPVDVARDLLGQYLVRIKDGCRYVGRIVEVEAYLGVHDKASHSARGRTTRNAPMFGPPGHAYVYLIYGMHHCMNIVTEPEGQASAILVRAVEPVEGVTGATNGPGRLCRAMSIDRSLDGCDLLGPSLHLLAGEPRAFRIVQRPRIGVDYAGAWARRLLRFYVEGSAHVSRR